ncbi:MAG: cytochrome c [Planctomycetaceae bacterium]
MSAENRRFSAKRCSKCHGEDGRGQTADNRGADAWGFQTRAADLTSGMLHGGNRPIDIYRRIHNGINGTPMPSFANALKSEPDTIWDLVAYVLLVSNERRSGNIPRPGLLRPYVAVGESALENPPSKRLSNNSGRSSDGLIRRSR